MTTPTSAITRFLVKALSTTGVVQIIITEDYHWIRIKSIHIKFSQKAISRDNITTKRVHIFSRRTREHIIAYKLMSHKQSLAGLDIDLFTNTCGEIINNIVNNI